MAMGIITVTAYIVYVSIVNSPATDDIQTWAKLMLIFIGDGVPIGEVFECRSQEGKCSE